RGPLSRSGRRRPLTSLEARRCFCEDSFRPSELLRHGDVSCAARGVPRERPRARGHPSCSVRWMDWWALMGGLVLKQRIAFVVAIVATIGCARRFESSASGDVIDPAAASKTVVLHVENQNQQPMELRTVLDGRSTFVGSVGASDTTS